MIEEFSKHVLLGKTGATSDPVLRKYLDPGKSLYGIIQGLHDWWMIKGW